MKGYIFSLSFALLVSVSANMLVPSKKYEGIMKILCGMFVISVVISPLKNIFDMGKISFDTEKYFLTDSEYDFRINESKDKFSTILEQNGYIVSDKIPGEILQDDITAKMHDGKMYVKGVPDDKKESFEIFMNKRGVEVVFED